MNAAVTVVWLDSSVLVDRVQDILPLIPASYADAYTKNAGNRRTALEKLAAGLLLRLVLGISDDKQLTRNACGKPYLKQQCGEAPRYFNLSDDEGLVVLAAANFEIGVDVHCTGIVDSRFMQKMLSDKGYADFLAAPDAEKPLLFAKAWTASEAKVKCLGTGFALDYRQHPELLDGFHVETVQLSEKYVVSCAAQNRFSVHTLPWNGSLFQMDTPQVLCS